MSHEKKIRIPQQTRSIEKKSRIVDAAMKLFSEKGFQKTNAKEIASEAHVSVGTFYAYYTDKKALLLDILKRHITTVDQTIFHKLNASMQTGISGREIMRRIVTEAHKTHHHPPELLRTLLAMRYTDTDIARLSETQNEALINKLATFFESIQSKLRITDMSAAARVVSNAFEETMHSVAVFDSKIEQERLFDALTDMTATYLFKDPDCPL
ncbi:TetR/AcrR family transcriptional regulator [Pseudodesulfovibrio sediminis]|nr:TetR/AcrR family transcriptional regulator [Pseudodesulfovibrio sediminis]